MTVVNPKWVLALASIAIVLLGANVTPAADTGFVDRVYHDDDGEHKYVVFVPDSYSTDRDWPVILYLHGAGERGRDGQIQTKVGPGPFLRSRQPDFPFLVVFPQCEDTESRTLTGWTAGSADGQRALKILAEVEHEYRIDPNRRVLTGWSMGAYGAWSLAAAMPEHWSALLAVSGGGDPGSAAALKSLPVWAIHGARDNVVRATESREMVEAVAAVGGTPMLTELAEHGHDVWRVAFNKDEIYDWMLEPRFLSAKQPLTNPGAPDPSVGEPPFIPALEISQAVSVDISNRVLEAMSEAIPNRIPREVLSGTIADIRESTRVMGLRFNVHLREISYNAEVVRTQIEGHAGNRLSLGFGLQHIELTVGRTEIDGGLCSATAGPMKILIGHRRPVWFELGVSPSVTDERQFALELKDAAFDIPADNWHITPPRGVKSRSLLLSRQRVAQSLVQGMRSRKRRIQREVVAAAPQILEWIEKEIQFSPANEVVAGLWPLPVYRPVVRTWPERVTVSEQGLSVMLGVEAAAPDPRTAPASPRQINGGLIPASMTNKDGLRVTVSSNLLTPLSELVVADQLAHVHVLDIPEEAFAPLADRETLVDAVPQFAEFGEDVQINSELRLAEPLRLEVIETAEADAKPELHRLRLSSPGLELAISIRENAQSTRWKPLAVFRLSVSQDVTASVSDEHELQIGWIGDALVSATGEYVDDTIEGSLNPDRIAALFSGGWKAWVTSHSYTTASGLSFEAASLQIERITASDGTISASFGIVPVRVTNDSETDLVYRVREAEGEWTEPQRLEHGKTRKYSVSRPLTLDINGETHSVAPGAEFRYSP